jgi:hypothetical protein
VDTDGGSDDAIGVRRSAFALAKKKEEGTKEIIIPGPPKTPTCSPIRGIKATCVNRTAGGFFVLPKEQKSGILYLSILPLLSLRRKGCGP